MLYNDNMVKIFHKNTLILISCLLFMFLVVSRVLLFGSSSHPLLYWAMVYNILAIWGGMCGIYLSRLWGGFKSVLGRTSLIFGLGLLCQSFGQNVYNYFYLTQGLDITVPYPSIGDIGFFGSVLFYIYGVILLVKISGIKISFKSVVNKIQGVIIPLLILVISYCVFLSGYQFDWSNKLKVFLDFGYPFGQAVYVSIAFLTLLLARNVKQGLMRSTINFFLFALVIQYLCDFTFLYQANAGIFTAGGIVDFMYCCSYFVMSLSLIQLSVFFSKVNSENSSLSAVKPESGVMTDVDKLHNQILTEIIKRQVRIAGQLAWQEVKKVSGIVVTSEQDVIVSISGDPKKVVDELLGNYKNLFGDLAVEVSKNAVYYLVAELPADQIPNSLK